MTKLLKYFRELIRHWKVFWTFLPSMYSAVSQFFPQTNHLKLPIWLNIVFVAVGFTYANFATWKDKDSELIKILEIKPQDPISLELVERKHFIVASSPNRGKAIQFVDLMLTNNRSDKDIVISSGSLTFENASHPLGDWYERLTEKNITTLIIPKGKAIQVSPFYTISEELFHSLKASVDREINCRFDFQINNKKIAFEDKAILITK